MTIIPCIPEDGTLFAGRPHAERQRFKEDYRAVRAARAGANGTQLAALHILEKYLNGHFPSYAFQPGGNLLATYNATATTGTVTVLIHPDATMVIGT